MINKVMLIGRLGADPEVKKTKNGDSFANLSLATNKKVKDTTGCGDAFNACFLYNYFNNKNIKDCIKFSHELGKTVAKFKGAIIPKQNFNPKLYVI